MMAVNYEEFFIYVPTMNEVETLSHTNMTSEEAISPPDQDGTSDSQDWVKIPLAGQLVVYARTITQELQEQAN